jgi:hypothetical protein
MTRMMGIGYLGEVRQGPDGNLYQYMQGVDGLGNPVGGFWSRLKKLRNRVKGVVGRALPFAQRIAPFIPGASAALTVSTPFLKRAGVAGYAGIGELYEAADGSLYQIQGLAEEEDLRGMGEDDMTRMMGIGYLGEVRQGPDGNLYQYMQGVDGLGNPVGGFWSRLKKLRNRVKNVVGRALPFAQKIAPFIPGASAALTVATPFLKRAGVAGHAGMGALYEAADGSLYQMQGGMADDDDLRGLDDDEELQGLDEDDELSGFDEDDELQGFEDAEDELQGFDADEEMQGIEGYVRQDGMNGLERYEPEQPPQTRRYGASEPSDVWKPLW